MGNHDSELSIVMEDYQVLESKMDGHPYKAGHHAATLRRLLWREHLGLLPAQSLDASNDPNAQPPDICPNDVLEGQEYDFVADPLSDEVWDLWTKQATTNTHMYRHLFRADPDDHSKSTHDTLCLAPTLKRPANSELQSKISKTTRTSCRETTSSKAISTTHTCPSKRCGRNSIRSGAIWSGCRWIS